VRLSVDEVQAKIVRRIFSLYSGGLSIKAVAKRMDKERVLSPQPREQQSWAPSSMRVILRNERYRGVGYLGADKEGPQPGDGTACAQATRSVELGSRRDTGTPNRLRVAVEGRAGALGFRQSRVRRAGEQRRADERAAVQRVPTIFSGLLKCGKCGSHFVIVSGVGRNKPSAEYGCSYHSTRGTRSNARRISRDALETELLAKPQSEGLSDAAIDFLLEKLEDEIEKRSAAITEEMHSMQRRKAHLESELKNLMHMAATGLGTPAIRAGITGELSKLVDKTLGTGEDSVRKQMVGLRKFVRESLADVRQLIAGKHSNPALVRQELARHIDSITLLPEGDGVVRYKGNWKLLGSGLGYSDGAEGRNCTTCDALP
jgi:site-specific DNA recombinase